jgi:hypothetical protein
MPSLELLSEEELELAHDEQLMLDREDYHQSLADY